MSRFFKFKPFISSNVCKYTIFSEQSKLLRVSTNLNFRFDAVDILIIWLNKSIANLPQYSPENLLFAMTRAKRSVIIGGDIPVSVRNQSKRIHFTKTVFFFLFYFRTMPIGHQFSILHSPMVALSMLVRMKQSLN